MADENMDVPPSQSQDKTMSELRVSVSPPRDRQTASPSTWRSSTPPPAPFLPIRSSALATPTKSETGASLPRTLSSPSLMDSSPKPKGSTPPPLSFVARKAHELTPITRNTSGKGGGVYVDEKHVVVSPEDDLFGEHLSFPRDLEDSKGPALPPLLSGRAKSVGNIAEHQKIVAHMNSQQTQQEEDYMVPVKFPSDRKYYSFTCQKQFAQDTAARAPRHTFSQQQGLKPYQPTRESVGDFTGEELERIFSQPEQVPIPVDRQWSIPSIHLANHLNGSTTSYTDEEDELDNASWSSLANSLYVPDDEDIGEGFHRLNVGVPKYDSDDNTENDADEEEEEEEPKKRRAKKASPIDWLKTIDSDGLQEAASSKFLTSSTRIPGNRRRSYVRNQSSVEEDHDFDDATL